MKRVVLPVLALLGLVACDPSDPCDPGYHEEHGACYPNRSAGDGDGGSDEDAGDDDGGEPSSDPYEGFGDACEEESECREGLICGAPQLALCTQVNCLDDETICPPDWVCFDVTGTSPDPSVSSVCLRL